MPDVLPTIPQEPAQGIQALLDTVYLWNPDVANDLIAQVNELLEELGELSNISGAIKPYGALEVPVRQYMPMSYNNGVYVANELLNTLPEVPDLEKWTLIATKIDPSTITQEINAAVGAEADLRSGADTALQGNIDAEERARIAADNSLQTQIDAISAASDVTDIVGTHAELEAYDTSSLKNNDIIKVLQDETQEDATTYYRWSTTTEQFTLIGEEGPYYTKGQTDTLLSGKQDTLTAGEGISIEDNVISATTTGDFVPQYSVMPTASAENVGELIQYSGETGLYTNGYFYKSAAVYSDAEATISQTAGAYPASIETSAAYSIGGDVLPINYEITDAEALYDSLAQYGWQSYINTQGFTPQTSSNRWLYVQDQYPNIGTPNGGWINSASWLSFPDGAPSQDFQFYTRNYTAAHEFENLEVDIDRFEEEERPTGDETVSFVATVVPESLICTESGTSTGTVIQCTNFYGLVSFVSTWMGIPIGDAYNWLKSPVIVYYYPGNTPGERQAMTFQGSGSSSGWLPDGTLELYFSFDPSLSNNNVVFLTSYYAGGPVWYRDNVEVQLSDYGISYSGAVMTGDEITVNYVAPRITGYTWERTDVQPAPEGIEWDWTLSRTRTQINEDYSDGPTLGFKLPTAPGKYHFYISVGGMTGGHFTKIAEETILFTFEIPQSVTGPRDICNTVIPRVVMDGSTAALANKALLNNTIYGRIYKTTDGEFWFVTNEATRSDIRSYTTDGWSLYPAEGPYDIYKLSLLFNDTAGTSSSISPTVASYSESIIPSWVDSMDVYVTPYVQKPDPRKDIANSNEQFSESQYLFFSSIGITAGDRTDVTFGKVHVELMSGNDKFLATVDNSDYKNPFVIVDEASGVFANTSIGYNDNWSHTLCLYLNTPSGTTGRFSYCVYRVGGDRENMYNLWYDTPTAFVALPVLGVGKPITAATFGKILQYTGATDSTYTNGYFYKASGTSVTVPDSMTAGSISPSDFSIAINAQSLISALMAGLGWTADYVRERLQSVRNWEIGYDVDSGTITNVWWGGWGPVNYAGVADSFTISGGTQGWSGTIFFQGDFVAQHTEIQNPHWERVDVQPAGSSLPDQTGQSGKFLTTDGTSASWGTVESLPTQIGNAGKFLTTDGTDASWSDGIDCEALGNHFQIRTYNQGITHLGLRIAPKGYEYGGTTINYYDNALQVTGSVRLSSGNFYSNYDGGYTLGTSAYRWYSVYTQRINNGADITVPTTGGTMAVIGVNTTVTLAVADWSSNTQTVSVTGMTADGVVFVNPTPANQSAYTDAGILCTAQAAGSLTFTCDTVPSADITVTVVML